MPAFLRTGLITLVVLLLAGASSAQAAGPAGREADPVVVTGTDVPALLGAEPGRIVAFAYDSGWHQVPVQVDERAMIDYAAVRNGHQTSGRPFSNLAYADQGTLAGADPDPTLDADDEIAAMAMDSGEPAGGVEGPKGVEDGSRTPLRIVDPLDLGSVHFLYLFRSQGALDQAGGRSYVDYDFRLLSGDYKSTYDFDGVSGGDSTQSGPPGNPEDSSVSTDHYYQHLGARWIGDGLVNRLGSGVDILDGDKAQVAYGCGRSELTFSRGGGGFIANVSGPVRAIRSYIGSNSGTYTQRDDIYYQRSQETTVTLRVHPGISTISQFLDYAPGAAGMTYRNSAVPAGATIDGTPDPALETGNALGPPLIWEQVTGAPGTLSIVNRLVTDMPGVNIGSYYQDDSTPTTTQCSGYADAQALGASGSTVSNSGQNSDPTLGSAYSFTGTRNIFFSAPGGDAALAAKRAEQVDAPLQVSVAEVSASGEPKLELVGRAPRSVSGGKQFRLRAKLTNLGDADAMKPRVCVDPNRGKRKCLDLKMLIPGRERTLHFRLRAPENGARLKLRFRAKVDGAPIETDREKVKLR